MSYSNVSLGMKKLFRAEILSLIAAVLTGLAVIFSILTVASASAADQGVEGSIIVAIGGGIGLIVFFIAAAVISIIAFILKIKGVNLAGKDEANESKQYFKSAFVCIMLALVCSACSAIFTTNQNVGSALNSASSILDLCSTYFILFGISNFADKIGNAALSAKAQKLVWIIVITQLIAIIAQIIAQYATGALGAVLAITLSIIGTVLTIVQYIMYLSVLSKAKTAFD